MESVFLACFLFGLLFSIASVALGAASAHVPGIHGHGHLDGAHDAGGTALSHAGHAGSGVEAHGGIHSTQHDVLFDRPLPLLNFSSALAFLTWFGAAGYSLQRFGAWPLLAAFPVAVLAGAAGSLIVALFLRKVLAGERVMDPRDYALEGMLARVTVTIPADGVGEIVFATEGVRRSEAARSLSGAGVARGTEVVVLAYARGVATVQAWDEFTKQNAPRTPELGAF